MLTEDISSANNLINPHKTVSCKTDTVFFDVEAKGQSFRMLKYLLFAIPEREGMVAVAITSDAKNEVCPGLLLDYSYDDLTQEEKDAFVFPIERKDLNE